VRGDARGVERVLLVAPLAGRGRLGTDALELRGVPCEGDRPAVGEPALDVLGARDTAHLHHGVAHRRAERQGGVPAVAACQRLGRLGEPRRAPPAVAPGRAETGDLLLDDQHVERGVGLVQVVGGPQTGEPGADDDDVGGGVAVQGRPLEEAVGRLGRDLVPPE
jgi:hypothetical protein